MISEMNSSRLIYKILMSCIIMIFTFSCKKDNDDTIRRNTLLEWNKLILELERNTPGYRAPVSARMFAYVELAAYMASREICPPVSIENLISNISISSNKEVLEIEPGIALSNCMYELLNLFFATAPESYRIKISELNIRVQKRFLHLLNEDTYSRSLIHGSEIAKLIWSYSKSDTIGHDGFLFNYDHTFKPKECIGCWQVTGERAMPALLPHWGNARTFLVDASDIEINPPVPYDTSVFSDFYRQALEVLYVSKNLDDQRKRISDFWSDDIPGLTISPVGRWFNIAIQAIEQSNIKYKESLELFLLMGMALNDAGVICWNAKYNFNVQRPETYIMKNIESDWISRIPSPSFPSYPSGHSIFGGAASSILENYFGTSFQMTDKTHLNRTEFIGTPRTYKSFAEMAKENALSRIYIGVHYSKDCEEGLRLGRLIGKTYIQKKNNLSFLN